MAPPKETELAQLPSQAKSGEGGVRGPKDRRKAHQQKGPTFGVRDIDVLHPEANHADEHGVKYTDNALKTTKYTLLTFLPKNLFEQFRRIANFYFLIVAVIQLIPGITPVSPVTSFLPLIFVLVVSAIKEAREDYLRYRDDKKRNETLVLVLDRARGAFVPVQWQNVRVGDVLKIMKHEAIPCDCVVLSATGDNGVAFVETSGLDGETNLKQKQALGACQVYDSPEKLAGKRLRVRCEGPTIDLYTFTATFTDNDGSEFSLSKNEVLLRGCSLKNTDHALAVAVYTGHQTKLALNAGKPPSKRTTLERHLNRQIVLMMIFQGIVVFIAALLAGIFQQTTFLSHSYLHFSLDRLGEQPAAYGTVSFFTYLILFNVMIPISLYVSMEMVKVAQAWYLESDLRMYYPENDTPARARTSNLNEELGQVEYIFSDKTGTLTRNVMEFMKCTVGGKLYGKGVTEIESAIAKRAGKTLHVTPSKVKGYNFEDPQFAADFERSAPNAEQISMFKVSLAVNHAVLLEQDPDDPSAVRYQAASPDENALVLAAKYLGLEFVDRGLDTITVLDHATGERQVYIKLAIMEFTSARARSSIVVRCPDKRVVVLSKGSDSAMFPRLIKDDAGAEVLENTVTHMKMFAEQGLRTLVFAYRWLSEAEYAAWAAKYQQASVSLEDRENKIEAVNDEIERGLTLVGASAIEDKLQEGVPEAIEKLEEANIKVWMLTGDKQETAINIGFACNLIDNSFYRIVVNATNAQEVRDILERELKTVTETRPAERLALIIDGFTMGFIIDPAVRRRDEENKLKSLQTLLYELTKVCTAVIACRMSPKQKRAVVNMIKTSIVPQPTCLSIGDGANDVPMIQKAHIGVGISGEEGLQAVRAADFAIAQFRFLVPLLLKHGRWNYNRIAKLVLYSFYKNMTFSLSLFWFSIFTGFSGQALFESWYISLWNVIFTGVPIIVLAIFDQDVQEKGALSKPYLYWASQKGNEFYQALYWIWVARGVWHSAAVFFIPYGVFRLSDVLDPASGRTVDLWQFGLVVFFAAVITVTMIVCFEHYTWNVLNLIGILSVYVMLFAFSHLYGLFYLSDAMASADIGREILLIAVDVMRSGIFWFTVPVTVAVAVLPDFLWKVCQREFRPEPRFIAQEIEAGLSADKDVEAHERSSPMVRRMSAIVARSGQEAPQEEPDLGYAFDDPKGEFSPVNRAPTAHRGVVGAPGDGAASAGANSSVSGADDDAPPPPAVPAPVWTADAAAASSSAPGPASPTAV